MSGKLGRIGVGGEEAREVWVLEWMWHVHFHAPADRDVIGQEIPSSAGHASALDDGQENCCRKRIFAAGAGGTTASDAVARSTADIIGTAGTNAVVIIVIAIAVAVVVIAAAAAAIVTAAAVMTNVVTGTAVSSCSTVDGQFRCWGR